MNAAGWACTVLGVAVLVIAVWYLGYLSGRRRESGIWEAWLEQVEQEQQMPVRQRRRGRSITLRQVKFRR